MSVLRYHDHQFSGMNVRIHIGTSGWNYHHWEGIFYPAGYPRKTWLQYYGQHFATVEVNATFYRLPLVSTFENWRINTPEKFLMAVKANRFITHIKRLRDPVEPLSRFFSRVRVLGEKLGPILFQLPPSLAYGESVCESFFTTLIPYEHRCALEVRHASWLEEKALLMLEKYGIAFCISDTAHRYPYCEAVTADFVYIRLHGSKKLYASEYTEEELRMWAEKIRSWGRETFVYFDNDFAGYAPRNARRLMEIIDEHREGK